MQKLAALLPLLMLAGCNVDADNGQVTVQYNGEGIDNTADAVANAADQVGSDIGNTVEGAGERIENAVDNVDVDVNLHGNENSNSH